MKHVYMKTAVLLLLVVAGLFSFAQAEQKQITVLKGATLAAGETCATANEATVVPDDVRVTLLGKEYVEIDKTTYYGLTCLNILYKGKPYWIVDFETVMFEGDSKRVTPVPDAALYTDCRTMEAAGKWSLKDTAASARREMTLPAMFGTLTCIEISHRSVDGYVWVSETDTVEYIERQKELGDMLRELAPIEIQQ